MSKPTTNKQKKKNKREIKDQNIILNNSVSEATEQKYIKQIEISYKWYNT